MSSSVCHAPLPARMDAFTTRIYLRAVDQYERLLQAHFNKPSSNNKTSRVQRERHERNVVSRNKQQERDNGEKHNNDVDEASVAYPGTYLTVNPFRQWCKGVASSASNKYESYNVSNDERDVHSSLSSTDSTNFHGISGSLKLHNSTMKQFPNVLSNMMMPDQDLSLKYLALNSLELTAPASDVLLKNRLKSWFQLSGHPDGFAPAGPGTVWKRRTGGTENTERQVYEILTNDPEMRDCIPRYYREIEYKGETFIELQNLLFGFNDPHVMDIKLGTRTFLESEVSKTKGRSDLYAKMIAVDPSAPNVLENQRKAVTKLRYMLFREEQSSTCSHGFRIEAMKLPGSPPITDLKTVKSHQQVLETMRLFLVDGTKNMRIRLLERLNDIRTRLENSEYFQTHEVIGSSIFMIYDDEKVGVWLIDFAKTYPVPDGQKLSHRAPWKEGNHEDGFLFGLDNLISAIQEVDDVL